MLDALIALGGRPTRPITDTAGKCGRVGKRVPSTGAAFAVHVLARIHSHNGSDNVGTIREPASDTPPGATPQRNQRLLCQNSPNHLSGHVGQTEIAALVSVGHPLVVDTQQVEHRGMQIVDLDHVLDGMIA